LRGSTPNFRATNQKIDEALEMTKRQMLKLQEDGKELAQGVEELREDRIGLDQGIEELRRSRIELDQGIEELRKSIIELRGSRIGLDQGIEELRKDRIGLREDRIGLDQDIEELRRSRIELDQDIGDIIQNVEGLVQGTTQFTHDVDRLSQRTDKVTEDLQDGVQKSQQLIEKFNTLLTSSPHSSSRLLDVQQQRASNAVFFRAIIIGIGVNLPDHGNFSLSFLTKIRSTFVNCMNVFQFFSLYQIYPKNKRFSQPEVPFPNPSSTKIRSI
jgi:chromosome segregation ATPase